MPINREETAKGGIVVYEHGDGPWTKITANLWRAPDGDFVSVRSMTPELRFKLGANELDTGGTDQAAADHLRRIRGR
jgi:hypothetical protein